MAVALAGVAPDGAVVKMAGPSFFAEDKRAQAAAAESVPQIAVG